MANEECAHCGVLITEWSTVAKREEKIFCCPNCANAYTGAQKAPNEVPGSTRI
jgi:ribosomal protein L31